MYIYKKNKKKKYIYIYKKYDHITTGRGCGYGKGWVRKIHGISDENLEAEIGRIPSDFDDTWASVYEISH